MSPKIMKNLKTLFHALTTAQAAMAMLGGVIPAKYALIGIALTSTISFGLNLLTRLYPWLATEDESDDPKATA